MNKVQEFLDMQEKIIQEDRKNTLVALGLTEKEYEPDDVTHSYKYSEYDYFNGKRKYYRTVAINVTDEEYNKILIKTKQVEEINNRKERQKQQSISKRYITKKIIPIFEKQQEESIFGNKKEESKTGKCKVATILRTSAWIIGFIAIFTGLIISLSTKNFVPFLCIMLCSAFEIILCEALSSILDYLAELTAIARNGFKYKESD